MFRTHIRRHDHPDRDGAILLIVLVMLALFAVVGLLFVSYSQSQATSAQVRRSGISTTNPPTLGAGGLSSGAGAVYPTDPKGVVNIALRNLLYPLGDTDDDLFVAARGYDMSTMVYGNRTGDVNCVPYNGIGSFHEGTSVGGLTDRSEVINYSYIPGGFFDPERTGSRTDSTAAGTGIYVGRNAAYTYPDRNNAYVAVIDPDTGMVLAPSFHRPALFGPQNLNQSNPNWTSPQGRYMLLRPRPQENPPVGSLAGFHFPPPNPDGTITGDVQNLVYVDGRQRNDSIWMDFGLPVVDYQGKKVKALIAPMIIPLDGRFNLLAHGNLKGTGQTHASNMGFGPWEIDLGALTGLNASAVIANRYSNTITPGTAIVPSPRGSSQTTLPFAAILPPAQSRVDFDGAGTATAWTLPTGVQSDPTWPTDPYGNADVASGEADYHPGLFNPYQWDPENPTAPSNARSFPLLDLREMAGRYSDKPRNYGSPYLGQTFPASLGETAGSGPNNPTDLRRAMLTSISNSLARPGLAPNVFGDPSWTGSLQPNPTPGTGFPVFDALPALDGPNASGFSGTPSDILNGAPTDVRNIRASLGAVDLNRPLADYRDNDPGDTTTLWPMDPSTVTLTSYQAAQRDRQRLATDIFARLVVATGASATVGIDPTSGVVLVTPTVAVTDPEFAALRWLAQMSANIVDYIDSDDVMTTFVWNPVSASADAAFDSANVGATVRNQRTVYGVERPRLVVNETYAEVTNDPADKAATMGATLPFRVRFFVELLNPTSASASPDPRSPLAVYDTNSMTAVDMATPLRYGTEGVYKLEVYHNATAVGTDLQSPDNVTGEVSTIPPMLAPDLSTNGNMTANGQFSEYVEPNSKTFNALGSGGRAGFAVIGPQIQNAGGTNNETDTAFAPATDMDPWDKFLQVSSDPNPGANPLDVSSGVTPPAAPLSRMEYYVKSDETKMNDEVKMEVVDQLNFSRHAVVLRRLACPYQPHNADTNPYITVDYMGQVKVHDAVKFAKDDDDNGTTMTVSDRAGDINPDTNWAVGRAQPFAGFQGNVTAGAFVEDLARDLDPAGSPAPSLQDTLTFAQQPTSGTQKVTLFRHNSTSDTLPTGPDATLVTPFEWLVHLDRKLVNAVELMHVSGLKPHELTHEFARPNADGGARPFFHRHDVQHRATGTAVALQDGPLFNANSPLYRMFEVLTVKPWMYGIPNGGRVPGRVNVNMLWDQGPTGRSRVFDAMLLANGVPGSNKFTTADLDAIWAGLKQTRSPLFNPANTPDGWHQSTFAETGTPTNDQPIHSFGAPLLAAGGSVPNGSGRADTLLRPRPSDGLPLFTLADPTVHPYEAYEPMRKVFNSVSTTTDCYLVIMTVGWFDVTNPAAAPYSVTNPPQVGSEAFREVPGDLRVKVVAVVDRTQLGVDNSDPNPLNCKQVPGVAFTELTAEVVPSTPSPTLSFPVTAAGATDEVVLHSEGKLFTIKAGTSLRLGVGDATTGIGDGEWVTVSSLASYDTATGIATVALTGPVNRYHPAGSPVSNAFLRNPGRPEDFGVPFDVFDDNVDTYRGVVPFVAELRASQ